MLGTVSQVCRRLVSATSRCALTTYLFHFTDVSVRLGAVTHVPVVVVGLEEHPTQVVPRGWTHRLPTVPVILSTGLLGQPPPVRLCAGVQQFIQTVPASLVHCSTVKWSMIQHRLVRFESLTLRVCSRKLMQIAYVYVCNLISF